MADKYGRFNISVIFGSFSAFFGFFLALRYVSENLSGMNWFSVAVSFLILAAAPVIFFILGFLAAYICLTIQVLIREKGQNEGFLGIFEKCRRGSNDQLSYLYGTCSF